MTRKEILRMPAGREMDALIVERVIGGFTSTPDDWSKESLTWFFNHKSYGALIGDPYLTKGDPQKMYSHSWKKFQPSTDIADAWEVIDAMCKKHFRYEIGGNFMGLGAKYATFDNEQWARNPLSKAFADSTPHAICRAALLTTLGEQ